MNSIFSLVAISLALFAYIEASPISTQEPGTLEPTLEPTTSEPVENTTEPNTEEPTTSEPGNESTQEPGSTNEPNTAEPSTEEPTTTEPLNCVQVEKDGKVILECNYDTTEPQVASTQEPATVEPMKFAVKPSHNLKQLAEEAKQWIQNHINQSELAMAVSEQTMITSIELLKEPTTPLDLDMGYNMRSFEQAILECQKWGGYIAYPETIEDTAEIIDAFNGQFDDDKVSAEIYVGLKRVNPDSTQFENEKNHEIEPNTDSLVSKSFLQEPGKGYDCLVANAIPSTRGENPKLMSSLCNYEKLFVCAK